MPLLTFHRSLLLLPLVPSTLPKGRCNILCWRLYHSQYWWWMSLWTPVHEPNPSISLQYHRGDDACECRTQWVHVQNWDILQKKNKQTNTTAVKKLFFCGIITKASHHDSIKGNSVRFFLSDKIEQGKRTFGNQITRLKLTDEANGFRRVKISCMLFQTLQWRRSTKEGRSRLD